MRRFGFMLAILAIGGFAFAASAASAPAGGGATLTLDQPDPHVGDTVTFSSVNGSYNVDRTVVSCPGFTSEELTYTSTGLGTATSEPVLLPVAGDCTANLFYHFGHGHSSKVYVRATITFTVSP